MVKGHSGLGAQRAVVDRDVWVGVTVYLAHPSGECERQKEAVHE